jgi:hypothetical protein
MQSTIYKAAVLKMPKQQQIDEEIAAQIDKMRKLG